MYGKEVLVVMNNDKKTIIIVLVVIVFIIAASILGCKYYASHHIEKDDNKNSNTNNSEPAPVVNEKEYNTRLIKTVHGTQKGNYLISPYSIEIALNMLKDGANGESKNQIEQLIKTRNIPTFNVKNRINVANATFIKEDYAQFIESGYYQKLKGYKADLVYDKFITPDKINNWVNQQTYGMIPKLLDVMSPDFLLGLANAVAIDVKWDSNFECMNTREAEFTKEDNSKMKVEMMHDYYSGGDNQYFKTDNAEGVILPYYKYNAEGEEISDEDVKDYTQLEFVGILPNTNVNDYIKSFGDDTIKDIDSKSKKIGDMENTHLSLYLPRFSYSFDLGNFKEVLESLGVKDVFDPKKADLTNIVTRENIENMHKDNIYVNTAIHKTYIDLNEDGTKAAAVTYFDVQMSGMAGDIAPRKEPIVIEVKFDKPFIYMIRDTKTKEILFFGVVREPNVWKGKTCRDAEEE